jgi:hypothetical protein
MDARSKELNQLLIVGITPYFLEKINISSSYHEFIYRMMYNGFVIFMERQEDLFLPGR